MSSEKVSIKIVNDILRAGESVVLAKGSELTVNSTTAAALILSGAAVELRSK